MRREIFLHFSFWFSFFVFIALANKIFDLSYWPFWLGGIIGTILPDVDHLLYLYLHPSELTVQRVNFYLNKHEIKRVFTLLYETRSERKDLIFHTAFFQVIFMVLTFWVLTSSGSNFGKGLVLAFSLHLLVDQMVDITKTGSFSNWLKNLPWEVDLVKAKLYWLGMLLTLCALSFMV